MKKVLIKLLLSLCVFLGFLSYLIYHVYYFEPPSPKVFLEDIQNGIFKSQMKKKFLEAYQEIPESFTVKLHEHIPLLFSTEGACTYLQDPTNPRSVGIVLPGRRLPSNMEFTCENGVTIKTSSDTSAFLTPSFGKLPSHLIVYFGSAEIRFSKSQILLSTKSLTLTTFGGDAENSNIMVANRTGNSESILCLQGNVRVGIVENIITDTSSFLGNQNCKLEILNESGSLQKVLNPGEAVKGNDINAMVEMNPIDLTNNSVDLPSKTSNLGNASPANNSKISMQVRSMGDILQLSYTLPMNGPAVCDLKTGSTENGPFSDAYQFQAPNKTGTLDLQKGFNSFFLSLQCTDGKNKYLSNVLAPKK